MTAALRSMALTALLCSCAATTPEVAGGGGDNRTPLIAPGRALDLPHPADLGRSVQAVQLITARRNGETFVFEGHLHVTPERALLVGVDTMGRRAMAVSWTDAGMQVETAPWLPETLRPGSMLADIVTLYWPEGVVRQSLSPADGKLHSEPGSRVVRIGGRDVLRAQYGWKGDGPWTGALRYANLAWGYEIDVVSMEVEQ